MNRGLAVVLLVIGVVLITLGFNEYGAVGSKLSRALSGRIPERVMILWLAGGVSALLGLVGVIKR